MRASTSMSSQVRSPSGTWRIQSRFGVPVIGTRNSRTCVPRPVASTIDTWERRAAAFGSNAPTKPVVPRISHPSPSFTALKPGAGHRDVDHAHTHRGACGNTVSAAAFSVTTPPGPSEGTMGGRRRSASGMPSVSAMSREYSMVLTLRKVREASRVIGQALAGETEPQPILAVQVSGGTRDNVWIALPKLLVEDNREETAEHRGARSLKDLVCLAAAHPLVDPFGCAAGEPGGGRAGRNSGFVNQPGAVTLTGESDGDDVVIGHCARTSRRQAATPCQMASMSCSASPCLP